MSKQYKKLTGISIYLLLLISYGKEGYGYDSLQRASNIGDSMTGYIYAFKYDSTDVNILKENSVDDTLVIKTELDTSQADEEFSKKTFVGTARDLVIGAISLVVWLCFMWLAANSS